MSYGQYSYESTGSPTQVIGTAERYASKRVKHVFKSDEIFHLWAHGQDTQGIRAAGASISAPGDGGLYSYSTCIAMRTTDASGHVAYLVSANTHSVTTSSHISAALGAIPYDREELSRVNDADHYDTLTRLRNVWRVETSRGYGASDMTDHNRNADKMLDAIREKIAVALESRKPKKPRLLLEAVSDRAYMRRYCEAFAITVPEVIVPISEDEITAYTKELADRKARKQIAYVERQARIKAEDDAMRLAMRGEALAVMALWVKGETLNYRERTAMRYFRDEETALRIADKDAFADTVETSQGATFPIAHAVRGLALVRSVMARGEEWRTNGHTCHLGHYKIDRITAEGTVYAGCHVVTWAAISRIAPELDAYKGGE